MGVGVVAAESLWEFSEVEEDIMPDDGVNADVMDVMVMA